MKARYLLRPSLFAALASALVGCRESLIEPESTAPIRIGLQAPLTGDMAYEGTGIQKAVTLLVEQTNAAGGIGGRQVELLVEDDRGSAAQAAVAANRLIERGAIAVIGGYNSTATEVSAAIHNQAGVLQITPSATATQISQNGYARFFRTCGTDDRQGIFAAELIDEGMGYSRVALLHDFSIYARGLADWTRVSLQQRGLSVVYEDGINPETQDFRRTLADIAGSGAQVVYFTGYWGQAGLLLGQAAEAGLDAQWMLGDASNNPEVIRMAGVENARGVIITTVPLPGDIDTDMARTFRAAFAARYGSEPESVYWVEAADAYRLIEQAIRGTGSTDAARLADYLHHDLRSFAGITGTIEGFDANGDRRGTLYRAYVVDAAGVIVPYQR
ncbi:MAG TPA: branched-chain amino acid ABC transporter substrate-binding protein [Gemmatimonadaceae bacterium]|nr:branched-chain amino acid ABC transporter substrate-binding protein [Gemmatimonadaceae bacterium]